MSDMFLHNIIISGFEFKQRKALAIKIQGDLEKLGINRKAAEKKTLSTPVKIIDDESLICVVADNLLRADPKIVTKIRGEMLRQNCSYGSIIRIYNNAGDLLVEETLRT